MGGPEGVDRRTRVYRDLIGRMPRSGVVEEVIDGERYRYLPEPRCRICSAGDARKGLSNGERVRWLVDTLLMYPKSMADVLHAIEPMMESWPEKARITYKSIRTHMRRHLAWDQLALRMMVERWASERGISVMDAAGRMILTEEAWLEASAQMGWQQLRAGVMPLSWKDAQQAWERMADLRQQAEGEYSVTHLLSQLNRVIEVIREEIPAQYWPRIVARLEQRDEQPALPAPDEGDDVLEEIMAEQVELGGGG